MKEPSGLRARVPWRGGDHDGGAGVAVGVGVVAQHPVAVL